MCVIFNSQTGNQKPTPDTVDNSVSQNRFARIDFVLVASGFRRHVLPDGNTNVSVEKLTIPVPFVVVIS